MHNGKWASYKYCRSKKGTIAQVSPKKDLPHAVVQDTGKSLKLNSGHKNIILNVILNSQ